MRRLGLSRGPSVLELPSMAVYFRSGEQYSASRCDGDGLQGKAGGF